MTAVVVAAMGGDDYNYYSDFSTTVSSSSKSLESLTLQSSGPSSPKTENTPS